MNEEDVLRFFLETAEPVEQTLLIGMSRETFEIVNFCPDHNRFSEEFYFFRPFNKHPSQSAFRLVSDENNAVSAVPKVML